MSSNRTGSNGRSAVSLVDGSTRRSSLFGDLPQQQLVREVVGDPEAALACAQAAMARVEQEIDHLWHDSMTAEDRALSERLAEVSHALQRAARLLKQDRPIG